MRMSDVGVSLARGGSRAGGRCLGGAGLRRRALSRCRPGSRAAARSPAARARTDERGGNGHYYAFVAADDREAGPTRDDGRLGLVDRRRQPRLSRDRRDAAENAFIVELDPSAGFTHKRQVWLGGFQSAGGEGARPGLALDQPRGLDLHRLDAGRAERRERRSTPATRTTSRCGCTFTSPSRRASRVDMRGKWNDENGQSPTANGPIVGYIVEWEARHSRARAGRGAARPARRRSARAPRAPLAARRPCGSPRSSAWLGLALSAAPARARPAS